MVQTHRAREDKTFLLAVNLRNTQHSAATNTAMRDVAATMASDTTQPLYVVSAYEYTSTRVVGLPGEQPEELRTSLVSHTDDLLARHMERYLTSLRALGREVVPLLRVGKPATVIAHAVNEVHADVLIMGMHHTHQRLGRKTLGRTVQHLLKDSPCTVVLVAAPAAAGT